MAVVAVSELVKRSRRWLEDEPLEVVETVGVNTSATTLTFSTTDAAKLAVGSVLEWDDNTGEQALVKTLPTSTTATVKRAHNGTTAATHAANAVMLKDPTWGYDLISEAILRTIDSETWPHMWTYADATVTPVTGTSWYNLADAALGIITVSQLYNSNKGVVRYGTKGSGLPISFEKNLPATLVASGTGIYIPHRYNTNDITVRYAKKITATTIEDGAVAEAIVYGALTRLLGGRDLKRVTADATQGQRTVSPGSPSRTALFFRREFERARDRAFAELNITLPIARTWSR